MKQSPDEYDSDSEGRKLSDVQTSTRSTRQRYHDDYDSPERVRDMFHGDISASGTARRIQRDSEELGLPTLEEVREDFDELCRKLEL